MNKLTQSLMAGLMGGSLAACGGGGGGSGSGSGSTGATFPALSLDTSFGGSGTGWVLTQPSTNPASTLSDLTMFEVRDAVRDPASGKFLVTGRIYDRVNARYRMGVWRLNADGTLDTGFGVDFDGDGATDGFYIGGAGAPNWGNAISLDSSGNILVAGRFEGSTNTQAAVWRLKPDGTEDPSFKNLLLGGQPVVIDDPDTDGDGSAEGAAEAFDVKALFDGRVALVGTGRDTDNDNTMVIWVVGETTITIGGISVSGWVPDTAFFGDGAYEYRFPGAGRGANGYALDVTVSGYIFAVGSADSDASGGLNRDVGVWCVNANGTRCNDFTGPGSGEAFFVHDVAGGNGADEAFALFHNRSNGDLYVAGRSYAGALRGDDAFVMKLTRTGTLTWSLDNSFGNDKDGDGVPDGMVHFGSDIAAWYEAGRALDLEPTTGKIAVVGERALIPATPMLWLISSTGSLESETIFDPAGLTPNGLLGALNGFSAVSFTAGGTEVTVLGTFVPDVPPNPGVLAAQYLMR